MQEAIDVCDSENPLSRMRQTSGHRALLVRRGQDLTRQALQKLLWRTCGEPLDADAVSCENATLNLKS